MDCYIVMASVNLMPNNNILANSLAGTASVNLTNDTILTMQSTNTHGARAKTSATRTSSTTKEDQPQYVTITRDSMDYNIVMANQLNNDTKFLVNLVLINNILPNSLAGTAPVKLVPINNILPNSLAGTASVNLTNDTILTMQSTNTRGKSKDIRNLDQLNSQ